MNEDRTKLETAFLNTNYFVENCTGDPVLIRIGECNEKLDELLHRYSTRQWAFITAYNPYASQLNDEENARHHADLCEELNTNRIEYLTGYGESAEKNWPRERSVLALGLDRDSASNMGRKFGQLAIVVGELGGAAELLWCDAVEGGKVETI